MQGIEATLHREGYTLPPGKDWSDTAATLATWQSRGGKWGAKLVRNYAGAFMILETKDGRSCGCASAGTRFRGDDAAALAWAREYVPAAFDVVMREVTP